MDAAKYQEISGHTWKPEPADEPLGHVLDVYYNVTQLNGEAGEVAGMIAKWLKFGKPLDRDALKLELGDVLWHLTRLGELFGMSLDDIMAANITKLQKRHPDGDPSAWYFIGLEDVGDADDLVCYTLTSAEANL